MKGSGFISSGSYGCVNDPPVKCETNVDKNKKYYKNTVGKYFNRSSSALDEYKAQQKIKEIDSRSEWTLPLYKKCIISDFTKLDEAEQCEYIGEKGEKYLQLIFKNGGVDLDTIIDRFSTSSNEIKMKQFLKVFKVIKPVLKGLKILNERGYCHLDIKPGNILFDGKKLSVIDFGLLTKSENIYKSTSQQFLLFSYPYYPPEFKLFGQWLNKKDKMKKNTFINSFKKNIDTSDANIIWPEFDENLSHFHAILSHHTDNFTSTTLMEKEFLSFKEKIDIYSFGFTLLEFYQSMIVRDNMITLLIHNLLLKMIKLNPYERIYWDKIIEEYEMIEKVSKYFSKKG